jgi:lysophospholipase L1-like esterase
MDLDAAPTVSPPAALTAGEATRLLAGAPWRRVAVLGDSVATGEGDPAEGYPDRPWAQSFVLALEQTTGPVAYRNTGERGLVTSQIQEQQLLEVLDFEPDLVIAACGGNDVMRRSFEPEAYEHDLEQVVAPLAATGALVVTFGLFDLSQTGFVPDAMRAGLQGRLRQQSQVAAAVNRRHHGVHVDFVHHPASADPSIWSADAIHPNRRGQAIVLAELVRALADHLEAAR